MEKRVGRSERTWKSKQEIFEIPRGNGNPYEEVDEQPKKGKKKRNEGEKNKLGDVRNIDDLREGHLSAKWIK